MTADERWSHQQRCERLARFARMGAQDRITGQGFPSNFDTYTTPQQNAYTAGRAAMNTGATQ